MSRSICGKATLFRPDDPLAPPEPVFDEPWQAQALALADTMVREGHFSASEWAETFGGVLKQAADSGAPDTLETYYTCVVTALEQLSAARTGITPSDVADRRAAWEAAYHRTPHGKPVVL